MHSPPTLLALSVGLLLTMVTGARAAEPTGIAVVELFTSEGCSSCPPADAVLNRLADAPDANANGVFLLAFPVDYWNRLGWVDPLSSARFAQRQSDYAALGVGSLFTPAVIVNGSTVVLGSDEAAVRTAIAAAQKIPATVSLTLTLGAAWAPNDPGERIAGTVKTTALAANTIIVVALVQDGFVQDVPRGENAGRRLRHQCVVRDFVRLPMAGAWSLPRPSAATPAACRVLAWAQDETSGGITGATQAVFR